MSTTFQMVAVPTKTTEGTENTERKQQGRTQTLDKSGEALQSEVYLPCLLCFPWSMAELLGGA
jgi:hypothetical protein